MTTTDNFTIDLVSNGSMSIFPNNTLSKFENQIDPALELDGEWEVALTEIYFPLEHEISIKFTILLAEFIVYEKQNLRFARPWREKDSIERTVSFLPDAPLDRILEKLNAEMENATKNVTDIKSYPKFIIQDGKIIFSVGLYEIKGDKYKQMKILTEAALTNEIKNKMIKDNSTTEKLPEIITSDDNELIDTKFYFKDKYYGKCYVKAYGEETTEWSYTIESVLFPKFQDIRILKHLGFNPSVEDFVDSISPIKQKLEVPKPLNQKYEKNEADLMYVYADIIRDHNVGGTKAPILRTIPLTSGIYQGIGYCTFEHRIYYPIRKNHIESVSVILTDDTGDQIKFAGIGRVFLSLDFRKKN